MVSSIGEKKFSYKDDRVTTFGETNQQSHFHAMN